MISRFHLYIPEIGVGLARREVGWRITNVLREARLAATAIDCPKAAVDACTPVILVFPQT